MSVIGSSPWSCIVSNDTVLSNISQLQNYLSPNAIADPKITSYQWIITELLSFINSMNIYKTLPMTETCISHDRSSIKAWSNTVTPRRFRPWSTQLRVGCLRSVVAWLRSPASYFSQNRELMKENKRLVEMAYQMSYVPCKKSNMMCKMACSQRDSDKL
jgi:hypothetical protein